MHNNSTQAHILMYMQCMPVHVLSENLRILHVIYSFDVIVSQISAAAAIFNTIIININTAVINSHSLRKRHKTKKKTHTHTNNKFRK